MSNIIFSENIRMIKMSSAAFVFSTLRINFQMCSLKNVLFNFGSFDSNCRLTAELVELLPENLHMYK